MDMKFRMEIFKRLEKLFAKDARETDFDKMDNMLSAFFESANEMDAAIVTDCQFMPQYNDREGGEAIRFYSTLAINVKTTLMDFILERIQELNMKCIFGHFGLNIKNSQIYFCYTMKLDETDIDASFQQISFVWDEIYNTMQFFLAYVVVISQDNSVFTLDEYMEAFHS